MHSPHVIAITTQEMGTTLFAPASQQLFAMSAFPCCMLMAENGVMTADTWQVTALLVRMPDAGGLLLVRGAGADCPATPSCGRKEAARIAS